MSDRVRPSLNPAIRNSRHLAGRAIDLVLSFGAKALSNKSQVIESRINSLEEPAKLLIFHTFSMGKLDSNVLAVVEAFSNDSWRICLISNGPFDAKALPEEIDYVLRNNRGFDFGGYRDALRLYDAKKADRILLLNDSMIWSAKELLKLASQNVGDLENSVWALTSSDQVSHHLQSFFYLLSGKNVTFMEELEALPNFAIKRMAVSQGELRLSRRLKERGVNLMAFYEYGELTEKVLSSDDHFNVQEEVLVRLNRGISLNPTQHLWEALEKLSFPGVKKSLICKNPERLSKIPKLANSD